MSLEESMAALAEANKALAASNLKLVESQERVAELYEGMTEAYNNCVANGGEGQVVKLPAAASAAKADAATSTGKKPGRPKKDAKKDDAPPADDGMGEDDGFGDDGDDATPALDFDTVKAELLKVRDKFGDKSHALAIIKEFGYSALPDIQEKDFAAIYKKAQAKLK